MGRGQTLKTKKKEALEVSKAKAKGFGIGKIQAEKKIPIENKLWEWLKDKVDPLEFAAVIALTPLVKMSVDQIPNLIESYKFIQFIVSSPVGLVIWGLTKEDQDLEKVPELLSWLIAFALSYVVIRHFDAILAAGKDLGGFIKMLVSG